MSEIASLDERGEHMLKTMQRGFADEVACIDWNPIEGAMLVAFLTQRRGIDIDAFDKAYLRENPARWSDLLRADTWQSDIEEGLMGMRKELIASVRQREEQLHITFPDSQLPAILLKEFERLQEKEAPRAASGRGIA